LDSSNLSLRLRILPYHFKMAALSAAVESVNSGAVRMKERIMARFKRGGKEKRPELMKSIKLLGEVQKIGPVAVEKLAEADASAEDKEAVCLHLFQLWCQLLFDFTFDVENEVVEKSFQSEEGVADNFSSIVKDLESLVELALSVYSQLSMNEKLEKKKDELTGRFVDLSGEDKDEVVAVTRVYGIDFGECLYWRLGALHYMRIATMWRKSKEDTIRTIASDKTYSDSVAESLKQLEKIYHVRDFDTVVLENSSQDTKDAGVAELLNRLKSETENEKKKPDKQTKFLVDQKIYSSTHLLGIAYVTELFTIQSFAYAHGGEEQE